MWQKRKEFFKLLSILTFQRFWNLQKLLISYWVSIIKKKPLVWAHPFAISIEPTTLCNLHCAECPTGNKTLTRPMGKLDVVNFNKIIDQVYLKTFYLNLYLQGEPFLHPEIIDMISYATKKRMFVCISTNGHFLDEKTCSNLVKSGIQKIIISVDGATNESYNKYRKDGELTKVLNGIKMLSQAKQNLNSSNPEIVIQMLVNKYNEHEINNVKQLTKAIGANRLELKSMQIYNDNSFLSNINKHNRYIKDKNGNLIIKNKLNNRCFRLWSNAAITWDGKLIPCCYDKNATCEIGNIQINSFKLLWNNNELNTFRQNILNNRNNIDICKNCTE